MVYWGTLVYAIPFQCALEWSVCFVCYQHTACFAEEKKFYIVSPNDIIKVEVLFEQCCVTLITCAHKWAKLWLTLVTWSSLFVLLATTSSSLLVLPSLPGRLFVDPGNLATCLHHSNSSILWSWWPLWSLHWSDLPHHSAVMPSLWPSGGYGTNYSLKQGGSTFESVLKTIVH